MTRIVCETTDQVKDVIKDVDFYNYYDMYGGGFYCEQDGKNVIIRGANDRLIEELQKKGYKVQTQQWVNK